ncbi:tumor necrosis factor receptor superfamily member 9 isoform X2 [Mauremys reevesii]|uniref:tumor necrosis factor receptor superfamily member 9 isoform X2 n=1 Tax=Mauremys reevesii TaxID=260615 RepID=UPI00193F2B5F|nr:tumor necrosis factor receptor superfamily member 9 isoform X2 [Mauremys reevesii]
MGRGHSPLVTAALLLLLSLAPAALTPALPQLCAPGKFLGCADCGKSPDEVCLACPRGTFSATASARESCTRCRRCEGKFKYKRECSPTMDAECACKDGHRCIGKDCSKCVENCGVGREPLEEACQTCPSGTFNNQTNGPCRQWTKCLPDKVLVNGTNRSDVVCKQASETMTPSPISIIVPIHKQGKDLQVVTVGIAVTVAVVVCIMFLLPLYVCFSICDKKKLPAMFKKMKVTPEQSTQEEDACSCRFPEEEQGDCDDCSKSKLFRDSLVH